MTQYLPSTNRYKDARASLLKVKDTMPFEEYILIDDWLRGEERRVDKINGIVEGETYVCAGRIDIINYPGGTEPISTSSQLMPGDFVKVVEYKGFWRLKITKDRDWRTWDVCKGIDEFAKNVRPLTEKERKRFK